MEATQQTIPSPPRYSVTEIPPRDGFTKSRAVAINDNGQVAVILSGPSDSQPARSYLWDEGRMTDLGTMNVKALNNSLQIVGTYHRDNGSWHAALWQNGKTERLFPLQKTYSLAESINDLSQIVGQRTAEIASKSRRLPTYKRDCYLWSAGSAHPLATLPQYAFGGANFINNRGDIVGYLQSPPAPDKLLPKDHAALWEGDTATLLGNLPGFHESQAIAINNRRQILCTAVYSQIENLAMDIENKVSPQAEIDARYGPLAFYQRGFLWDDGILSELGPPNTDPSDLNSIPRALNDHCQVVGTGGCSWADAESMAVSPHAFLFDHGAMLDLHTLIPPDSGWTLTDATAINNRGQIAGVGKHLGNRRAFLLTPIAS